MNILNTHLRSLYDLITILESDMSQNIKDAGVKEILLRDGIRNPIMVMGLGAYLTPQKEHLVEIQRPLYLGGLKWLELKLPYFEKLLNDDTLVPSKVQTLNAKPKYDVTWATELIHGYLYLGELLADEPQQETLDSVLSSNKLDPSSFSAIIEVETGVLTLKAFRGEGNLFPKFPNNTLDLSKVNVEKLKHISLATRYAFDVKKVNSKLDIQTLVNEAFNEVKKKRKLSEDEAWELGATIRSEFRVKLEVKYPDLSLVQKLDHVTMDNDDSLSNYGIDDGVCKNKEYIFDGDEVLLSARQKELQLSDTQALTIF